MQMIAWKTIMEYENNCNSNIKSISGFKNYVLLEFR